MLMFISLLSDEQRKTHFYVRTLYVLSNWPKCFLTCFGYIFIPFCSTVFVGNMGFSLNYRNGIGLHIGDIESVTQRIRSKENKDGTMNEILSSTFHFLSYETWPQFLIPETLWSTNNVLIFCFPDFSKIFKY